MKNKILKYCCLSFFVFYSNNIFPQQTNTEKQEITFRLYGKYSCCNDVVKRIDVFRLTKDSISYSSIEAGYKVDLILPDTGLYFMTGTDIESKNIHINKIGLNIDTALINGINEGYFVDYTNRKNTYAGWQCFEKKCNGYQVDRYENGNIFIEGHFRKGKAIGEVKVYDENGKLSLIWYYNKRGKYLRREDFKNE